MLLQIYDTAAEQGQWWLPLLFYDTVKSGYTSRTSSILAACYRTKLVLMQAVSVSSSRQAWTLEANVINTNVIIISHPMRMPSALLGWCLEGSESLSCPPPSPVSGAAEKAVTWPWSLQEARRTKARRGIAGCQMMERQDPSQSWSEPEDSGRWAQHLGQPIIRLLPGFPWSKLDRLERRSSFLTAGRRIYWDWTLDGGWPTESPRGFSHQLFLLPFWTHVSYLSS